MNILPYKFQPLITKQIITSDKLLWGKIDIQHFNHQQQLLHEGTGHTIDIKEDSDSSDLDPLIHGFILLKNEMNHTEFWKPLQNNEQDPTLV